MVFKSLRRRLLFMGLVPTGLLMIVVGLVGFVYIRQNLLDHWQEASLLKLERAGHYIKMRLNRPIMILDMLKDVAARGRGGSLIQNWILDHLSAIDGISQVKVIWNKTPGQPEQGRRPAGRSMMPMMMAYHHAEIAQVSSPNYDAKAENNKVRLSFSLQNEAGKVIGQVQLAMDLDYILQDLRTLGWWESEMACLVDQQGNYLVHTGIMAKVMEGRKKLGRQKEFLGDQLFEAMSRADSGTVFGSGHPPNLVAGYYRIKGTPWTLIMYADGQIILGSIAEFRLYYFISVGLVIVLVLFLIRSIEGRVIEAVEDVSTAARDVAEGRYHHLKAENGQDEIGVLVRSFNSMVDGLEERDSIRDAFGRYMDPDIAKKLMRTSDSIRMGGEKREVAILMSDIRGFTNLVESMSPEDTVRLLNHYFSHVIQAISLNGGIIIDFFGDGILVFFDPLGKPVAESVARAFQCAQGILQAAEKFNDESRRNNEPEFPTAVGVNSGPVVVGNIGSETRVKYGIVGLAVNITQRIQSFAKGGQIAMSDAAYRALDEETKVERTLEVKLKGVAGQAKLHLIKGAGADSHVDPVEPVD